MLLLLAFPLFAQVPATVRGSVLDPDAAAIPGATVTLTPARGAALVVRSQGDGSYAFPSVPAGNYTMTITMPGFASFVRANVRVGAAPLTIDVKLVIQEQSTEINVTTQGNQVSTDPDSNGNAVSIKGKELEALSDDPDELSNELSALAGPAAGPNGGQVYVDGFTGGQLPPKSSIREIRVNQNPFSAQFDKTGYGRVEVFTKPGTDKYHGNLSVQGNDKAFNTSSPFLGPAGLQPGYHQLFFIGNLTGPIRKNASISVGGSHRTIQDNGIFSGQIVSAGTGSATLCAPGDTTCNLHRLPAAALATFHPQQRYDFTPRVDLALGEKNTLTVRYQFEHNDAQNNSVGVLNLPTFGNNISSNNNEIQISDTQILSPKVINETRFAFERGHAAQIPLSTAPAVVVQGSFNGGGSFAGAFTTTEDRTEVQNYTSVALTKHFIRAGGRLRIYRQASFANANANGTFLYATAADYINNRPFQYNITQINQPRVDTTLTDLGLYLEDDWKARPNLTVSYGLRLETEGAIHSNHDLAPRLAISYGIPRKSGTPSTVLRFGYGVFYDRFGLGDLVTTLRQNGTNQIQTIYNFNNVVLAAPVNCSPGNTAGCGTGTTPAPTVYELAPSLRSAYNLQAAVGVDQQIGKGSTLSVNFINTDGVHDFFSRVVPTGTAALHYQFQSEGVFHQKQIFFNARTQASRNFSLFSFYVINIANSNANGSTVFATDSTNPRTDYGRATLYGNRQRFGLFGNYTAPHGVSISPFVIAVSGQPYNVTVGRDVNGDTIVNDRAGFANGVGGSCFNGADFTAPAGTTNSYSRIPAGYCTGPANASFNLRLVKAFGFGEKLARGGGDPNAAPGGPPGRGGRGGPAGGGPGGGPGRGGPGGFGNGGGSGRRYTVSLGAQALNLFNIANYGVPNGSLSSYSPDPVRNLFGRSESLAGGPFASQSALRRVFLQLNFGF